MYKKLLLTTLAIAGLLALFATPQTFAAQKKPIDVLIIGNYSPSIRQPWWPELQKAAAREGIRLNIIGEGTRADSNAFDRFTPEFLKQFHVVIFNGAPHAKYLKSKTAYPEKVTAEFRDSLDAYYKSGGSIIWCPLGYNEGGHIWNELVGKRYDVESFNESIHDPSKRVLANPIFKSKLEQYYIWTSAVSKHPVTKGVRGLTLPLRGEYNWPGTIPMRYGKSWDVLVRGMDSTITYGSTREVGTGAVGGGHGFVTDPLKDFTPTVKGTYNSAPEIIGVRDSIKDSGRMFVFPFHTAFTWANFNNWVLGDAFMLNGAGGHPSEGFKLFVNATKWLAEPAMAAGLGGYKAPQKQKGRTVVPSIDWTKASFPENSWSGMGTWWNARLQKDHDMESLVTPNARNFKGVIGARTALSTGKGSVADYVAEAKKLDLSFIVFLEDLTAIDDKGYATLVKECEAHSDENFLAVPGYFYRDTMDFLYYMMGEKLLPTADNLTPDRRVMIPQILNIYKGSGIAELGKNRIDPWYLMSYNSIAVYVYEDGKLTDDGLAGYQSLQGRMNYHPGIALTFVSAPALLKTTVEKAPLTIVRDQHLNHVMGRLAWKKLWNPNPVYLSGGPLIKRWGLLNPYGHPFAPGKQRTRFALEVTSDVGIADVKILDPRSGEVFRHFRPEGKKAFSCSIDETHKLHWHLIPIITDVNGGRTVGPTLLGIQDANRVIPYSLFGDGIDSGNIPKGWDKSGLKLVELGSYSGGLWTKGGLTAGNKPYTKRPHIFHFDGGGVGGSHASVDPKVITSDGVEPKHSTYRLEKWQAPFDYIICDYKGDLQYLKHQRRKREGFPENWWAITEAPVPTEIADVNVRTIAVRPRDEAPFSANRKELKATFKKDTELKRIELCKTWRSFDWGPMFVVAKDTKGKHAWVDDGKANRFHQKGELGPGDYIFPGNDGAGAPVVINLGPETLSYEYSNQTVQVYVDGKGRKVKAGETIAANFMLLGKGWEGQMNSLWIDKFIADYGIGGGKPGYSFEITQGQLKELDYTMTISSENGGAGVNFKKHNLPHNLLAQVEGIAANAVAGRYDNDRKQLLIVPVFENTAATSINTTLGDTSLYIGELFHCDNPDVVLSCVQDGADKLLLEVHNPTDKPQTVKLSAVPGFTPLAGLNKSLELAPFSSTKLELPTPAGTLVNKAYMGD